MRLDKFLVACGEGSRSEVKKLIKKKLVTINGIPAEGPEQKVDEQADIVCLSERKLCYAEYHYYLFHKPKGCITATQDREQKTVMDFFPEKMRRGLAPVGRLDRDTEGLLLITDDGALAHHLLSPSHHVPKTYYAVLDKPVPKEAVVKFAEGVDIGDQKRTLPAKLTILPGKGQTSEVYAAELTITEGRYHQVKRMFAAVGCEVTELKRLTMGTLSLGQLPIGEYRELTELEVFDLRNRLR